MQRWSRLELLLDTGGSQTKIEIAKQVTILTRRRERGLPWARLRLEHFKVDGASYGGPRLIRRPRASRQADSNGDERCEVQQSTTTTPGNIVNHQESQH
jgi:hypothetical protein